MSIWTINDDETPWTCGDCRTAVEYGEDFGHTEILFSIDGDDGNPICYCPWFPLATVQEQDKFRARARLIAAAPELLASLKDLLPVWESGIKEPWIERAQAIIAYVEQE